MLSHLKINNFALIDDVELTFDRGMSVLTGETGAGKSVIVMALALALGDRADREQIRHGSSRAVVTADFSVERMSRQYKSNFADYLEDGTFRVTREISRDGSSKVKINGAAATVSRLRELTAPLAEILGQHSSRLLLDEENHLVFLDSFASVDDLRQEVAHLFGVWDKARADLRRTRDKREEFEKERELLLFQQEEIEKANIRPGEESELNRERRILDSSRALIESADRITTLLGNDDQSAIDLLRLARSELDKMVAIDSTLEPHVKQLLDVDYLLEEIRSFVEKYGRSVPDDPRCLEEINERLDEIYRMKQKYGGSEEGVVRTLNSIQARLKDRPDTTALLNRLESEEAICRTAYSEKAIQLSEVRKKAARYLHKLVVKEMAELAVPDAQFDSEFIYDEQPDGVEIRGLLVRPHAHGLESCRFLFSANPGEPLRSLVRTASGGEVSRLLLALKASEKKNHELSHSLLVFDEVDAGIGGQTAIDVGQKIQKLSQSCQMIVITHLHQIARFADHHFLAEKTDRSQDRVTINVTRLEGPAVSAEIDRMVALPE